ncbi:MAG TPA: hypothetical protein VFC78_15450 [Tepidisphaeraceae bacterium]|nr:hypothetical protein [Tepidisphaeraceae bacterium]
MPELAMDAPSLKGVGARLNADWMAVWINNPRSLWAGSHMPRLFAAKDAKGVPAFDNDGHRQFQAIWNYLLEGKAIVPPAQ